MGLNTLNKSRSQFNIIDANEKGIGFPFLNAQEGMFSRRFGIDVLIDDIIALIHIFPGEYPNEPELGVGIHKFLFELQTPTIGLEIEDKIEKQIIKYILNINLISVDVKSLGEEKSLEVTVRFQKKDGSKDVIKVTANVSNSQTTIESGLEA